MPNTARIAVIGTGWWATTAHIPALQANQDANLVALADVRADALHSAARHYGVDKTCSDYRAILAQEQNDQNAGCGQTPTEDVYWPAKESLLPGDGYVSFTQGSELAPRLQRCPSWTNLHVSGSRNS